MHNILYVALAIASGAAIFLSFPTFDLFPLAWFGLVPVLWAIERVSPRRAFWFGLLTGTVTNLGGFYWITGMLEEFGHLHTALAWAVGILLFAYQGLVYGLWAGFGRFIRVRLDISPVWVYPLVFVALEWAMPFIFPWYLANGQYRFTAFIQVADLIGVTGISWLLVLMNAGAYRVVDWSLGGAKGFPRRALFVPALVWLAVILYGVVRVDQVNQQRQAAPKLKLGMVEANIGIWEKEARGMSSSQKVATMYANLLKHQRMSAQLEADGAELIVWPESSFIPLGAPYVKVNDRFFMAAGRGMEVLSRAATEPWSREKVHDVRSGLPGNGKGFFLRGSWGWRDDELWLVGDGGVVLRFDGTSFRRLSLGIDENLSAISGSRRTDPVIVGRSGGIYRLRVAEVDVQRAPDGSALNSVALLNGDTFLAVGDQGRAFRIGKDAVETERTGTTSDLLAVDPPFAVGRRGTVLQRTAKNTWQRVASGTQADLRAVRGLPGGGAIAVGDGGVVLRLDRTGARSLNAPTEKDLSAVALFDGIALVAGEEGTVLRLDLSERVWSHENLPLPVDITTLRGLDYFPVATIPRGATRIRPPYEPLPEAGLPMADAVSRYRKAPARDRDTVQRGFHAPVLFGVVTRDEETKALYNTAMLLDSAGKVQGAYDKTYLLLFGEYLPLADRFPILRKWIPEAGRFTPGETVEVFPFGDHDIGVMICYEDIIPAFGRKLAGKSPNLLINVTNDAWFGKTSEPYQHLVLALFRAIEHRLYLVRSTNTGVSAIIDPTGRIVAESDLDDPEVLLAEVALMDSETVYQSFGDVFAHIALGASLLLFGLAGIRDGGARRKAKAAKGGRPARKAAPKAKSGGGDTSKKGSGSDGGAPKPPKARSTPSAGRSKAPGKAKSQAKSKAPDKGSKRKPSSKAASSAAPASKPRAPRAR